jgi:hypothetical protein
LLWLAPNPSLCRREDAVHALSLSSRCYANRNKSAGAWQNALVIVERGVEELYPAVATIHAVEFINHEHTSCSAACRPHQTKPTPIPFVHHVATSHVPTAVNHRITINAVANLCQLFIAVITSSRRLRARQRC